MTRQRRILELVHGGDYACAFGETEGLRRVCGELIELVPEELASMARDLLAHPEADRAAMARAWGRLAQALRDRRDRGEQHATA